MGRLNQKLGELPPRFQWTLHNLFSHPLSEILFQLGLVKLSEKIHDITVPETRT